MMIFEINSTNLRYLPLFIHFKSTLTIVSPLLKRANEHLLHVLEVSNRGKSTIHLPYELLGMIFAAAISPYFLLDTSIAGGRNSPFYQSVRTKKAIIGVCKRWWHVGLEILYKDVVFHHIGQIPALARTLEANCDLGKLVKSIIVRCFVPPGYNRLFDEELRRVFNYCPLATHIVYSPLHSSGLPYFGLIPDTVLTSLDGALLNLPSKLTHIECGIHVQFDRLVEALHECKTLTWLSLQFPSRLSLNESDQTPVTRQLCLDRLEYFRCTVTRCYRSRIAVIAKSWSIPFLEQLRVDLYNTEEGMDSCIMLFLRYGRTLKYLHVYSIWGQLFDLRSPLQYCPNLEHLILCPGLRFPLSHRGVKWIDIWSPRRFSERQNYIWLRRTLTRAAFPALQNVRRLDCGLLSSTDWPRLFPPEHNVEGSGMEYRYPGVHIRVTAKQISKQDMIYFTGDDSFDFYGDQSSWSDQLGNGTGSDSDEDYMTMAPSNLDKDDTSDYSSWSSDSDIDGADEVSEEGDWADRETTLSIFHQTLG